MEIIVLGTGCAGCKALFETTQKAMAEMGIDATVRKEEDMMKIMSYSIMQLPGLVINGKVVSSGKRLNVEEVKAVINKSL